MAFRTVLPAAVVHEVTEFLFETRTALAALHVQSALLEGNARLEALALPIHPGARAFYDADKPLFIVEYAEPTAFAMSVTVLLVSGLWQVQRWLDARRKNRGDLYIGELAELVERLRRVGSAAELDELDDRIYLVRFDNSSKFLTDWEFLLTLKEIGRRLTDEWLRAHKADLGLHSTLDYRRLMSGDRGGAEPDPARPEAV